MHTWKKTHLNHVLFHCCKNFDTTIITDANDKTVTVQICAERGGRTWYWKRETLTLLSCLSPPPPTPFFKTLVQKTTLSLWMELAFFSALSML